MRLPSTMISLFTTSYNIGIFLILKEIIFDVLGLKEVRISNKSDRISANGFFEVWFKVSGPKL
ncbi:hypothetical protein D3C80_2039550 [compost metagenome]